jgi:dienelactone hydrolase
MVFLAGCTCQIRMPSGVSSTETRDRVAIYRHPLELRFSKPKSLSNILVVYATGDGGWRGLDEQIFEWISTWDYPAVGFSSKNYLKNLEYVRDTTTPRRLVRDFETVIRFAEQKLGMSASTRIVLVGLSRGAGLAVVAAGQGALRPSLAGVIAVALIKEEEHVVYYRSRRRSQPNQPRRELLKIETYEYLPRIDSVPVVVIQSTHDGYLPADRARALFGPDTEMKKLVPISARNHKFTGGRLELYRQTENALALISKGNLP